MRGFRRQPRQDIEDGGVNTALARVALARTALSYRLKVRLWPKQNGSVEVRRKPERLQLRNVRPERRSIRSCVSFDESAVMIIDPYAHWGERARVLDDEVEVVPNSIHISSRNEQPALVCAQFQRATASGGGIENNAIKRSMRPTPFAFNRDNVKMTFAGRSCRH
jgi:hypothetical protein